MNEFLIIAALHLLAVIVPGPDFFLVMRNSMVYSRKVGLLTAVGLGLGISVHVLYSLLGIALIISQSILLFNVIKIFGALYLMYLGINMLLAPSSKLDDPKFKKPKKTISSFGALKMAFLTNILNPKVTLFFLSVFTQVISPETSLTLKMLYGLEMTLMTMAWFSLVATGLTLPPIRRVFNRFIGFFEKAMGVVLSALGLRILFEKSELDYE